LIKLILVGRQTHNEIHPYRSLSFASTEYLVDRLKEHLEFEFFDSSKTYNLDTVFLIMAHAYLDPQIRQTFRDKRVIVDLCREAMMPKWDQVYQLLEPGHVIMYGNYSEKEIPNAIFVPNFLWYNECFDNLRNQRHNYVPNRNYSRKFLMPIGRKTKPRDHVVKALGPYLEDAYWSYVRRNKVLPGEPVEVAGAKRWNTRHQNPMWYDDTCFSVVVESVTSWRGDLVPFVTEKTYKPIAYQHPFMVIGAPGILKYLRSQGFETYDNLFDESYDLELNLDKKLKIIIDNIKNFEKIPYNILTQEKIKHNLDLFYNISTIQQSMIESIVLPIEEYVYRS